MALFNKDWNTYKTNWQQGYSQNSFAGEVKSIFQSRRVSLFIDFYNFVSCSNEFLNQKCFIDYTKIYEYFVDKTTQVYGKTYIYGGLNLGKLLDYL